MKYWMGIDMITKQQALEAVEDMDDFARMEASIEPIGAYNILKRFIEEHYQDSLRWKKTKELKLDIRTYHNGRLGYWFESYEDSDLDGLIENENN